MKEINKQEKSTIAKKLLYVVIPLFIILVVWFGWMIKEKYFPEKPVHYHAGFIVFKDNKQVVFSDSKYMHAKPCGSQEHTEIDPEEEQIEKAHLHDYVGDVVHVHRAGVQWQDLFTNLTYSLADAEGYLNGKKIENFQTKIIHPYDSLVVFIGNNTDMNKKLSNAVTKKYIEKVEQKSDNCGS